MLALALLAIIYGVWSQRDLAPILGATLRESTMLMFIIGMSLLYSYVMSYLHISQSKTVFNSLAGAMERGDKIVKVIDNLPASKYVDRDQDVASQGNGFVLQKLHWKSL